jgi:hypothetical protein
VGRGKNTAQTHKNAVNHNGEKTDSMYLPQIGQKTTLLKNKVHDPPVNVRPLHR